jgi:L-rhamnose isomerase
VLASARRKLGIDPDPIAALKASAYVERVTRARGAAAGGSGYPGS